MLFEGPFDDALLGLKELFEALLLRLKHPAPVDDDVAGAEGDTAGYELGTDDEVEAAARMARTLAVNDCLDICLDIYVKTRNRRAAKAMMRFNPAYLKSYTPEKMDAMEWESLDSAMALWSPHFHVAIASVLAVERRLCERVLEPLPPAVWPECFAKITARIVAAFFRFADAVAAVAREPQRVFKLLDLGRRTVPMRSLAVATDCMAAAGPPLCAWPNTRFDCIVAASCGAMGSCSPLGSSSPDGLLNCPRLILKLPAVSLSRTKII